jgi:DNA-nicking Smr family endonuclease
MTTIVCRSRDQFLESIVVSRRTMAAVKLKLDLHEIYNRGAEIDWALQAIIDEAVAKKAPLVEIIPGKGSGALKKRVLRFLDRKEIRALYHRVEKDSDNFGRIFVHFRWK